MNNLLFLCCVVSVGYCKAVATGIRTGLLQNWFSRGEDDPVDSLLCRCSSTMDMALRLSGTSATASLTSHLQSLPSSKSSRQWSTSSVLPLRHQSSRNARSLVVRAAEGVDVDIKEGAAKGDVLPSGEWAENFSLLNYEDLSKHYETNLFKPEVC